MNIYQYQMNMFVQRYLKLSDDQALLIFDYFK